MAYKHGAYGEIVPSQEQIDDFGKGTIPVYVGVAPVHRVKEYSSMVNTPILIRNLEEAKIKLGYSPNDDFEKFTLSAAIYAHLQNRIKAIAPIVVINVLDPDKHKKTESKEVTLINDKAIIDENVIVKSVTIENKELDKDYSLDLKDGKLVITNIKNSLESSFTIKYDIANLDEVTEEEIIGGYDNKTDKPKGIACIQNIYEELNVVPSIISAPGFNHISLVEKELVTTCKKIGGHWDAICVTDIDSKEAKTLEEAKKWKSEKGYNSLFEKTLWPKAKIGDKVIWLSILAIVRMQQTDAENNNIPYETPSNKQIDITGLVLDDGSEYKINAERANRLNEKGITTALYFGGKWVLWGPHMANFEYGATNKAEELFDVNIRTNIYLSNDYQVRNVDTIDKPMSRNDVDALLNTEQMRINSLVAEGKLLYGSVDFITADNPKSDLLQGDFSFRTAVTNTPPAKSITNRIQYTSKGIENLIGGKSNAKSRK